jgi:hypothetical protein
VATITLTIPDAQLARVVSALCRSGGKPASNANAKAVVIDMVRQTVVNVESTDATAASLAALVPPADPGLT